MSIQADSIYREAYQAGLQALQSCVPTPMIVAQHQDPLNDGSSISKRYLVEDGVCGFASVIIKPARGAFVNYLKAKNLGHPYYYGGYSYSISEGNQSLTKKEAFAEAFCAVLRKYDINCYVNSRMD